MMDLNNHEFYSGNEIYLILYIIWVVAYVKNLRQKLESYICQGNGGFFQDITLMVYNE